MGRCLFCPPQQLYTQHSRCLKWRPAEPPPSSTGGVCRAQKGVHSAAMEEQGSKRKRVYPFEPSTAHLANFSGEYLARLLPALAKIGAREEEETEKMVMFEVNMALAASAGGFAWSRALMQTLAGAGTKVETPPAAAMLATSPPPSSCRQKNPPDMAAELRASPPPLVSAPSAPTQSSAMDARPAALKPRRARRSSGSKRMLQREVGQELHGGVRTLRRILPGGEGMGVAQLLAEVGSYVVCLELQVDILRSLLDVQEESH